MKRSEYIPGHNRLPLWVISLVAGTLVSAVGLWSLNTIQRSLSRSQASQLDVDLHSCVLALKMWIESEKKTVQIRADEPRVRELVGELVRLHQEQSTSRLDLLNSELLQALREYLGPLCKTSQYVGFVVTNPQGVNIAALLDEPIGQSNIYDHADFLKQVLEDRQVLVCKPFPSEVAIPDKDGVFRENWPTMFVSAPVLDQNGEVIAALSFRIRPELNFTRILWVNRPGNTGESYAFDRNGLMLSGSRFDQQLKEIGLLPKSDHHTSILNISIKNPGGNLLEGFQPTTTTEQQPLTRMALSATRGESGVDIDGYNDYRGVPVIGAWTWLEQYDFGIVSEIDFQEAYAPLSMIRFSVLSILILLLSATIVGIWLDHRKQRWVIKVQKSELQLRDVISQLKNQKLALDEHAIVSVADIKGDILYANKKFCDLSGYSLEELTGENHRIVKSDEHTHEFYRDLWETISSGNVWHGEIKNRAKDGSHYWVEATIVPFKNEQGEITQYVAVRTDITAMKKSERRYRIAVSGSRDGLWDWDLITDKVYYAPRWQQMLGLSAQDMISDSPEEWTSRIDQRDIGSFMQEFDEHLRGEDEVFEVELRMHHKEGHTVWMLCRGAMVRNKEGRAIRVAGSFADITEIKQAQADLRKLAEHDRLTELPNRELLQKKLQKSIEKAEGNPDFRFAVLFFDFDRFKLINDSLGHNVGDALLVDVAEQFRSSLRDDDVAARFGGDEFVVLLNGLKSPGDEHETANRLLEMFAKPHNLCGHDVYSTASIGLVASHSGYSQSEEMIRDADAAMYQAKEAGRGRVVEFDKTMHEKAVSRVHLDTDLHFAVERNELRLKYQPIVNIESGDLSGFEALVRWEHPTRGEVSPADFIPIAEDNGLIVQIGEWVLQEACRQINQWDQTLESAKLLSINVNLSLRQLFHPDTVEVIKSVLHNTGIDPSRLKLEITESTMVDDRYDMIPRLEEIKKLGIKLAMDDFGTGQSSLGSLHRLPVDVLKIDQSFVQSLSDNRDLVAVMQAIVAVADNLGMQTVAEGIETADQLVVLQALGCEFAQGYYFNRPLTPQQAEKYMLGTDEAASA